MEIEVVPSGVIVARDVSAEEYMEKYAACHYEWVRGYVIKMSPGSVPHFRLLQYLMRLFEAYFALRPIGTVLGEPVVMRVDETQSRREPDLQVILNTNTAQITETEVIGAADICIEIVSPESVGRDYGDKLVEYEAGGVGEYWIFDPRRKVAHFYRLSDSGTYALQSPDENSFYRTPRLPGFALHVPTLWAKDLPDILAIVETVKKMLGDG